MKIYANPSTTSSDSSVEIVYVMMAMINAAHK